MILVTGATGLVGRHLIQRLMHAVVPIRCLLTERQLRELPWDAASAHAPEIVVGSLLDPEASFRAVSGVHAVIHLANALWWGGPRDLERIEREGTANLTAAARASRVGRIITLSQLGASPSSAYTLHRVKGQVEDSAAQQRRRLHHHPQRHRVWPRRRFRESYRGHASAQSTLLLHARARRSRLASHLY